MSSFTTRKLSIGEFFLSMAAGLMLFLLPNDATNQFTSEGVRYGFIFIVSLVVVGVLYLLVKRYEAVGTALLTMAWLEIGGMGVGIISGLIQKGGAYWPKVKLYLLVSMFLLWMIPFLMVLILRLTSFGNTDTNENRKSFTRFLILSTRALMVIYLLVLLFRLILPHRPHPELDRQLYLIPYTRLQACIGGTIQNGPEKIIWNGLILAPLGFYFSLLTSRIRLWHVMIISLALGLTVEALQYLLNTGAAAFDDILLYAVGAALGYLIVKLLNLIRSGLTMGNDRDMMSFEYTPMSRLLPETDSSSPDTPEEPSTQDETGPSA